MSKWEGDIMFPHKRKFDSGSITAPRRDGVPLRDMPPPCNICAQHNIQLPYCHVLTYTPIFIIEMSLSDSNRSGKGQIPE